MEGNRPVNSRCLSFCKVIVRINCCLCFNHRFHFLWISRIYRVFKTHVYVLSHIICTWIISNLGSWGIHECKHKYHIKWFCSYLKNWSVFFKLYILVLSQSQWVSANNNNWVLGGIISSLLVNYHKLISISNTLYHTWSLDRVKRSYSLSLRGHLK